MGPTVHWTADRLSVPNRVLTTMTTTIMTTGRLMSTKDFGLWYRQHRKDSGHTQRSLADSLGVGVPHISRIETGRERASLRVLTESAELLNVDLRLMLYMSGRCQLCFSVPERADYTSEDE